MRAATSHFDITYSVRHLESALSTLEAALNKARRNPANSMLAFGELNTDLNTLTGLLGKAKSASSRSVRLHDVDCDLPRVSYWIQRGMIEAGRVRNILYTDSQPFLSRIISNFLNNQGYHVETTESAEKALLRISEARHELVILDDGLPGIGWMGLVSALRESDYSGKILLMTSEYGKGELKVCRRLRVDKIINKPVGCSELLRALLALTTDKCWNVSSRGKVRRLRKPAKSKRNRLL